MNLQQADELLHSKLKDDTSFMVEVSCWRHSNQQYGPNFQPLPRQRKMPKIDYTISIHFDRGCENFTGPCLDTCVRSALASPIGQKASKCPGQGDNTITEIDNALADMVEAAEPCTAF